MIVTTAPRGAEIFHSLMAESKQQLVRYAAKVQTALPHETIRTSGRKVDIALSLSAALARNPQ